MSVTSETARSPISDPVSNVLKWILLAVAVGSFILFAWATVLTYERAAPQPDRFVTASGQALMTAETIFAGKAGFQKADLMESPASTTGAPLASKPAACSIKRSNHRSL